MPAAAGRREEDPLMSEPLTVTVDADILDLAEDFLRNRRREADRARDAAARADLDVLRRIGHELKGTAGSYGFGDLSTIGASLESAAIAGDVDQAGAAVARMSDFLTRVSVVAG
jgi:HPt (histidine-containing phosphotransfer) domain-containing protein